MKHNKRCILFLSLILIFAYILSGCSNDAATKEIDVTSNIVSYDADDTYSAWDEADVTNIYLDGTSITMDDNNSVVINENQIEIHTTGTYVFAGTLTDGQVVIDAEDAGTVRLVLNGASIESQTTAPIYVKQADKTVISIEEGTDNYLSDALEYIYPDEKTDEPSAAIYSKDDLTINGGGNLTVDGNFNDGITGRDDLKITGGTITINAIDDGIVGRDLFALRDADLTINAEGDGVKSSNDSDAEKGNIVLESGSLTIDSAGDGIQSENTVTVIDGEYTITAGDGSPDVIEAQETMGGGFGGRGNFAPGDIPAGEGPPELPSGEQMTPPEGFEEGERPQVPEFPSDQTEGTEQQSELENGTQSDSAEVTSADATESASSEESTPSTKGIKAVNELSIFGGTISIDSNDDAIHSDLDVSITAGTLDVSTGDDGLHADGKVTITGGSVTINKSLEGIEGTDIAVSDGTIYVTSEDDGFNVSGGSDGFGMARMDMDAADSTAEEEETADTAATEESGELLIEGGYIYVNANGDGLDSNTTATMTGGTVLVYGPTNGGNGALDYNESFDIEGGTLIAAGSSGMAEGVSDTSAQATMMMTFSEMQEAGTSVYVKDSNGEEVIAITPEKEFQTIVISSPLLKQGENYSLSSGGTLTGENSNGLYENAAYEGGTVNVDFTMENMMTYVNESGVTEQSENRQGGFGRGMQRQAE
ncbi:carbohydrate-binding domain-containing protein [Gracilibacillus oryzae]|nr:carbohydrate-binding domain-containing protein [Gracilibacillus oryzae]